MNTIVITIGTTDYEFYRVSWRYSMATITRTTQARKEQK